MGLNRACTIQAGYSLVSRNGQGLFTPVYLKRCVKPYDDTSYESYFTHGFTVRFIQALSDSEGPRGARTSLLRRVNAAAPSARAGGDLGKEKKDNKEIDIERGIRGGKHHKGEGKGKGCGKGRFAGGERISEEAAV